MAYYYVLSMGHAIWYWNYAWVYFLKVVMNFLELIPFWHARKGRRHWRRSRRMLLGLATENHIVSHLCFLCLSLLRSDPIRTWRGLYKLTFWIIWCHERYSIVLVLCMSIFHQMSHGIRVTHSAFITHLHRTMLVCQACGEPRFKNRCAKQCNGWQQMRRANSILFYIPTSFLLCSLSLLLSFSLYLFSLFFGLSRFHFPPLHLPPLLSLYIFVSVFLYMCVPWLSQAKSKCCDLWSTLFTIDPQQYSLGPYSPLPLIKNKQNQNAVLSHVPIFFAYTLFAY